MISETKESYRKLSKHFYSKHMNGLTLKESTITSSLIRLSTDIQPAYFRRLKNALAFDLEERGYPNAAKSILSTVNPVTAPCSKLPRKAKPPRAKSFSDEDLSTLALHLSDRGYHAVWAAVTLARFTGARPAELKTMRVEGESVVILGAKKSHAGLRGADRILSFTNATTKSIVENCLLILNDDAMSMDAVRHRLRQEGKKIWPRRKVIPTLYSMRHQVGSNLKAAGGDPREIAYIMGHQSISSVAVYGGRRHGDPRAVHVTPAQEAQLNSIREKINPKKIRRFEAMIFREQPGKSW